MNDRELLEKAAKAAGIANPVVQEGEGWMEMRYGLTRGVYDEEAREYWNPLESDRDALRLAVKLRIDLDFDELNPIVDAYIKKWGEASCHVQCEATTTDPYAATRRAIVRVAAALEASALSSPQGG